MQQGNEIEAPEIRELITRLRLAGKQHAEIVAEETQAESDANRLDSELGQARAQLEAAERALAVSGGIPDEAFLEEAQIQRLERQRRVVLARVSARRERVATSRKAIDDLTRQIDSAWLQLGVDGVRGVLAQFRKTAIALRRAQSEHMAWLRLFSNKPGIVGWAAARVIDPHGCGGAVEVDGCMVFNGILVDERMLTEENYWRPLAGDIADAIQALHQEVEAAKAEWCGGVQAEGE